MQIIANHKNFYISMQFKQLIFIFYDNLGFNNYFINYHYAEAKIQSKFRVRYTYKKTNYFIKSSH
jgi:hypothetical protein